MTECIKLQGKTLSDLINDRFPGFKIWAGSAAMDTDLSEGVEINVCDNSRFGHGVTVYIYPFIEYTDGCFKPCHYWGDRYFVVLEKC